MNERIGNVLIISAVITLVVGAVLLATVGAIVGGVVILVGVFDLFLGAALRSGMLRPGG
jgi:hypothetical protein